MKSYFNTLKKPKYIKLCGDGDLLPEVEPITNDII
jgi:hypothetical protein